MMHIFTAQTSGATFGTSGKVFWRSANASASLLTREMPLPTGLNMTDTRGHWTTYNNRCYIAGAASDNILVDEHLRVLRQGILPPTWVPVLAAAAGPGTTGTCQVACAYFDELLDEWSPLSGVSNEVDLSNAKRAVTGIAASAETRVTDVGVFVSMDGAAFRLSVMRQNGTTSITEGVATLALGMVHPGSYTRMPRCATNVAYHERLIAAGSREAPDTVFVSMIGKPERYGGLSFKTKNGEHVKALAIASNDVCLVLTPVNCYVLRGYRDNDMSMTLLDPNVGAVNQACVQFTHGGHPVVVNQGGVWLYNGGFHNTSRDFQEEWNEFYKANADAFENSFAIVDPDRYTYTLFVTLSSGITLPAWVPTPGVTIRTFAWTMDYRPVTPQVSGELGQPHWFVDLMGRAVDSAGLLGNPGSGRSDVYLGFCDGIVRALDDDDADDDADTYGKRWWVRTKAHDGGDPGGNLQEGKTLTQLWTYMESESTAWTLYASGGDEEAWHRPTLNNTAYFWKDAVAASESFVFVGSETATLTAKTVHVHHPQRVSGRMFTLSYTALSPVGIKWRGFGGVHGPGRAARPIKRVTVGGT